DRPLLHLRHPAGDAHNHPWPQETAAVERVADKVGEHGRGGVEIGDDAVSQGPRGHDIPGGPADHLLRLVPHGQDLSPVHPLGHHRGFTQHYPFSPHVHQRIGCSNFHAHVSRESTQHPIKYHASSSLLSGSLRTPVASSPPACS